MTRAALEHSPRGPESPKAPQTPSSPPPDAMIYDRLAEHSPRGGN